MAFNDRTYKSIFSFREIISPFIKRFAPADIASHLDYSSLRIVDSVTQTDTMHELLADRIWVANIGASSTMLFMFFEFQSAPYKWMAVRVAEYVASNLGRMIQSGVITKSLPPTLAFVLYNGNAKWICPLSLDELRDSNTPESLLDNQLNIKYMLIDMKHMNAGCKDTLVDLMLHLEQATDAEKFDELIYDAEEIFKNLDIDPDLRIKLIRVFSFYIALVMNNILGEKEFSQKIENFGDLHMAIDEYKTWVERKFDEGLSQGKIEGKNEVIRNLMKNLGFSREQAIDAMGIPASERAYYMSNSNLGVS